jgi:Raf kinase inhibitor-like YbhB/YbcL family protein
MPNDPNWRLPEVPAFTLTSPDFQNGDRLPVWARGSGADAENRSPALEWSDVPAGTRSFALTMYDPDAPTGSGYWHWAVYGIPADTDALPADAGNPGAGLLPERAITLPNEARAERYAGAAPPAGHGEHRYFFTLSALDVPSLDIAPGSTPAVLGFLMREHVIGRAQLVGTAVTPA